MIQSWGIQFLSSRTFLAGAEKLSNIFIEETPSQDPISSAHNVEICQVKWIRPNIIQTSPSIKNYK
jgi:hypothetical protein